MKDVEERIKKLLRLGRSTNQAEAELALQRAFELAQKHRLSIEDLDLEKDLEPIAEKAFPVGLRISLEHKLACGVLQSYYNVKCILGRPCVHIFGTETDVLIAEYVLSFLVDAIRRGIASFKLCEKQNRRIWNGTKRANYIRGFIYGLHSKLEASVANLTTSTGAEIVPIDPRVNAKVDERFGGKLVVRALPKSRRNLSAMTSGFDQGRSTDINQPIAGEAKAQLR